MIDACIPTASLLEAFSGGNVSSSSRSNDSTIATTASGAFKGGSVAPTQNDILMGRGNSNKWHPGNVFFQSVIKKFRSQYAQSFSTVYKQRTISEIIQICTRHGGRFLELRTKKGHEWVQLTEKRARRKVALAIQYRQRCLSPSSSANSGGEAVPHRSSSSSSSSCGIVSPEVLKTVTPPKSYSLLDLSAVHQQNVAPPPLPVRTSSSSWPAAAAAGGGIPHHHPNTANMMAFQQLSHRIEQINDLLDELCAPPVPALRPKPRYSSSSYAQRTMETASTPWLPLYSSSSSNHISSDALAAAMEPTDWTPSFPEDRLEPRPIPSPTSVRSTFRAGIDKDHCDDALLRHPVCWSPTPTEWGCGDDDDAAALLLEEEDDDDDDSLLLLRQTFDV